ncbi:hypothetical protein [Psychromonas ossibalaenae]|uniref:hypothetical protein n=1 Tax=Psychromonas ossibalaenae TaxID=444922 RepID=UPI00035ECF25|nr:hypothetical protein [Psychromonas ossibalaenae]
MSRCGKLDIDSFNKRLISQLDILHQVLNTSGFGEGELSLGAELETNIVNRDGIAQYLNHELLDSCQDPRLTLELNRYNLELNLTPVPASGTPFTSIGNEILSILKAVNQAAQKNSAELVAIGILPTLRQQDLCKSVVSDNYRYKFFASELSARRGSQFKLQIDGENPFAVETDTIAYEGAGTSLQLHLRVSPARFANVYNAVQLVSPAVLAYAANSPCLLGHFLWDETRIALFKQSTDTRVHQHQWREPPRVNYGSGWNRHGLHELFAENVSLYSPLFTQGFAQDAAAVWAKGQPPRFDELMLHQGTVWSWNRGIYDYHNNGHVRIEARTLPAGPTVADMMANSAVLTGLAYGLEDNIEQLIARLPFKHAKYNFYRAAQSGIDAKLIWPDPKNNRLIETSPAYILSRLMPYAKLGLQKIGLNEVEISSHLNLFQQRIEANTSGARWQRQMTAEYEKSETRHDALHLMFAKYRLFQDNNIAVSDWDLNK